MELYTKKVIVGLAVGTALLASTAAHAASVDIISLDMGMTSLDLDLNNQIHSFSTTNAVSIVMGSYQNPIVSMLDSDGDSVTIYTASPNPAPSGTADADTGTLNVDFTSMLADFVLVGGGGGSSFTVSLWDSTTTIDTNTYDSTDSSFMLGWTTDVVVDGARGRLAACAGGRMGNGGLACDTTTALEGTVNTVPVPAAFWLFASGLAGLVGIRRKRNRNIA